MRELINKLVLLESQEVNLPKLSQGFKKDKATGAISWIRQVKLELEKDDTMYGGTEAELFSGVIIINFNLSPETGKLMNRMDGKLAFHDAPYRDFDQVWDEYDSSMKFEMQQVMIDEGLSEALSREIDLKGREMPIGVARFAITPNLLSAFNDAYDWQQNRY